MGFEAANIVAGQIYLKPDSVLGLATGSTPVSMYERLVAVHRTVGLDFSEVTTFNLDEYIGMRTIPRAITISCRINSFGISISSRKMSISRMVWPRIWKRRGSVTRNSLLPKAA